MRKLLAIVLVIFSAAAARGQGTTAYPGSLDTGATLPAAVDQKFTYLAAAITNSATAVTVNSTSGLPSTVVAQIDAELLSCSVTSATTLTCARGFSGTTGAAHAAWATVRFPLAAAHVNGVQGAAIAIEAKLGAGASPASSASAGHVLTKQADGSTAWAAAAAGGVTSAFGRTGAVTAQANDYTWAQLDKTTSSLADVATRSASDLSSGTLSAGRMPALTGDVTSSAGSVSTTLASVVTAGTNTKLTYDAKGRVTVGAQAQFSDIGGTISNSQFAAVSWTAPTLLNSWVNFGSSGNGANAAAGYAKVGSLVCVKGLVKSGTVGAVVFTLPAGYRPAEVRNFATVAGGAFGYVSVLANGDVKAEAGSNSYFSLDAIGCFTAEQ